MPTTEAIDPTLLLNEVLHRHPETIRVFHEAGMDACCGGMKTIAESARAHGVDLDRLLEKLNRSIGASSLAGRATGVAAFAAASTSAQASRCSCEQESAAAATRTVTGFYQHDHEEIDSLFRRFQERLQAGDFAVARILFNEYDQRLERHIEWEEGLLFPAFERGGGPGGPTEVLRLEHNLIREDKRLIRGLLATVSPESFAGIHRRIAHLVELLTAHNRKEEEVLYPLTDQYLGEAGRKDLFERMLRL